MRIWSGGGRWQDEELVIISALYVYAMYNTFNTYRKGSPVGYSVAKQCVRQFLIQACQGQPKLAQLLDNRWCRPITRIL